VRSVGLDVHRDFCEVAIIDPAGGRVWRGAGSRMSNAVLDVDDGFSGRETG
jgi:hypothetical protein